MKITSFEHACQVKGIDPEFQSDIAHIHSGLPADQRKAIISYAKLLIIVSATNEDRVFDWNNRNQKKWFPWFDMEVDDRNPTGFRFHGTDCVWTSTGTAGGSRLCFHSAEEAEYTAMQHLELFRDIMVIEK